MCGGESPGIEVSTSERDFRWLVRINKASTNQILAYCPIFSFELRGMAQFRAKKLDLSCFINAHIIRDHTKRKVFAEHETERQALRYIIRNTTLPQRTRVQAQLQLSQMHAYTRGTQIKNRCIMGGKGRGVFSDFRMARYQFRMNALAGKLPGVKKASW